MTKVTATVRDSVALGRAVRDARRGRGWTQGALATRAGLSQPTISNFERGMGQASLDTLWRLLAALELEAAIMPRGRRDVAAAWDRD